MTRVFKKLFAIDIQEHYCRNVKCNDIIILPSKTMIDRRIIFKAFSRLE